MLASAVAYVALTAIMGRRIIDVIASSVAGDGGDPLLTAAILLWNGTRLPLTDAWYQFPIFWPTRDALALSEHLLGVSVLAAPIQWLTGNPLTTYNLTVLLSYPLCGVAMYLLVWRLTRNAGAAFLAGLAYAFAPYRAGQVGHIQVLMSFWMPLSLLGLHAYLDTQRWRWLLLFAVSWALQGASNGYLLVYFTFAVAMWVAWFAIARSRWRDAAAISAALIVASLPLVPVLVRYVEAQRGLGLSRNIGEISAFSADLAAPLCAPAVLTLWGWLRLACEEEGQLFVGAGLIGLCLYAAAKSGSGLFREAGEPDQPRRWRVIARRVALGVAAVYAATTLWTLWAGPWRIEMPFRASASSADKPATVTLIFLLAALLLSRWLHDLIRRGTTATFYVVCGAVCWVLAWGPFPRLFGETVLYQAPYAWLLPLPGMNALRVPARLWLVVVVCLVVFMGLAVARLLAASSARTARTVVIAGALALAADGWTAIGAGLVPTQSVTGLGGRTVLVLPVGDVVEDRPAVFHAVTHGYTVINGYSGYEPPYYEALRALSAAADDRLFAPFVSRSPIDVLVKGRDTRMRELVERQPGWQMLSDGAIAHYRVPMRNESSADGDAGGSRLPIQSIQSPCSPQSIGSLTDGNLTTAWLCGVHEPVQEVTIDLGDLAGVDRVIQSLGASGTYFPHHLRIDTSTDGQTWSEAWEGSPAAAVLQSAMASPRDARFTVGFPRRPARFVRLQQLSREGYMWLMAELEVWGTP